MNESSKPTADPSADSGTAVVPNHHAHFPPFGGWSGLVAAIGFLSGRDEAADLAMDLTALDSGDHLVDIGCGPGIAAVRASDRGAEVIGIDPAAVMLRVARLRWSTKRRVDWREGAAESLPVADGWADVVWSLATVHHWDDLDGGLVEVARTLKPGGRFLAAERRIDDPYAEGVASHGWTIQQAETFAALCEDHGFVDATVSEHAISPAVVAVLVRAPG